MPDSSTETESNFEKAVTCTESADVETMEALTFVVRESGSEIVVVEEEQDITKKVKLQLTWSSKKRIDIKKCDSHYHHR